MKIVICRATCGLVLNLSFGLPTFSTCLVFLKLEQYTKTAKSIRKKVYFKKRNMDLTKLPSKKLVIVESS